MQYLSILWKGRVLLNRFDVVVWLCIYASRVERVGSDLSRMNEDKLHEARNRGKGPSVILTRASMGTNRTLSEAAIKDRVEARVLEQLEVRN